MRKTFRHAIALLAVTGLAGCTSTPPAETTSDVTPVNDLRAAWADAFNAGDAARLGELYTSDAVVMPESQPAVTGHDAIVQMYNDEFMQMTPHIALMPQETQITGDWAFDRGQFTLTITPKAEGATPMTEHGKYLVLVHHDADGWKIAREIGNSDAPMPPMPGMPGTSDMPGMPEGGGMQGKG